jgi:hypothetical protein
MPPFVLSLAFWKAVSFILMGVAALLVVFGVIPAQYGLDAGAILAFILSVLQFFGINPELRMRGLIK